MYYLKRCKHQELGSIQENSRPSRGRYLFVSKNENVLQMFPPLSTTQLNDSALLPIVSLVTGTKVYCNFVYHNDLFHNSTAQHKRNEYRIYLNRGIDRTINSTSLLFEEGDIVIMKKDKIIDDAGCEEDIYYLDIVKESNNQHLYNILSDVIQNSPIQGDYALYDNIIPEFEEKVARIIPQSEVIIDDSVTKRIEHEPSVSSLFNASSFRDFVMVGYKNLCAMTGTVIRSANYMNLEAAHIKPQSHGGLFLPNNGIAFSRDLHWAFDKGFFTLDDSYKIMVHSEIDSEYLKSFNGKTIRVPEDDFFKPNLENIKYHRENVYGLFLRTGRL